VAATSCRATRRTSARVSDDLAGALAGVTERARIAWSSTAGEQLDMWGIGHSGLVPLLLRSSSASSSPVGVAAPRPWPAAMAWEEPEEPWLNLATFFDGQFQSSRKPLGSHSPLIAKSLEGKSFFSRNVRLEIEIPLSRNGI
jgi:hypothetical protein